MLLFSPVKKTVKHIGKHAIVCLILRNKEGRGIRLYVGLWQNLTNYKMEKYNGNCSVTTYGEIN